MTRLRMPLAIAVLMVVISCVGAPVEQPTNVVSSEHPTWREADRINAEWSRLTGSWAERFGGRGALEVAEVSGPTGEWRRFESTFLLPHFESPGLTWRGSPTGPRLAAMDDYRLAADVMRGRWMPEDEADLPPGMALDDLPKAAVRFVR